jgi:Mrp family chromosome partitioning ATPase
MAINIAKAAASMGQKVLVVDADLRRPQIHHRLNLDNDHGLSNVIAEGLDWNEAIQSLPATRIYRFLLRVQFPQTQPACFLPRECRKLSCNYSKTTPSI